MSGSHLGQPSFHGGDLGLQVTEFLGEAFAQGPQEARQFGRGAHRAGAAVA